MEIQNLEEMLNVLELEQKTINSPMNLPDLAFRRNSSIYELVSYVNNLTGCYLSGNKSDAMIFINRCRGYQIENQTADKKTLKYYEFVSRYVDLMDRYLKSFCA